jgi:hypothetical protein
VALDTDTITRLLGSIEANRLVVLCGAGLSIPAPSNLMSAVSVSRACYDRYAPIAILPVALRDDVDLLAGHFHARGEFESVFLSLVPWDELVGEPNTGHAALADFLVVGAASAALSANFDTMIEQWANARKVAMLGALDGQEAVSFANRTKPLVKFHGCLNRKRDETLWTQAQLGVPVVAQRVQSCSMWMELNLPGKDLLIIGFWTDWGYLNGVLATAMATQPFGSVTVVDPLPGPALQTKAPTLWVRLTGAGVRFQHIQASGSEALDDLRAAFSKVWGRRFYQLAEPLLQAEGKALTPAGIAALDTMGSDELYDLRRDAEGVPYNRAARRKEAAPEAAPAALAHALLHDAGAARSGAWYEHGGRSIRIVHGSGQILSTVREAYREPPAVRGADIIVCAGARAPVVPGSIISSGAGLSVVRPAHGGHSRWLTLEQARTELAL